LQDGNTLTNVTADERYLRESLLNPNAKVTEGFAPNMPTYQGLVTEEQILQLISYMKTLTPVVSSNTGNTNKVVPPPVAAPAPVQTNQAPKVDAKTTENKSSGSQAKSEPAK
jgi:cytochrome c oxidase subunit 2